MKHYFLACGVIAAMTLAGCQTFPGKPLPPAPQLLTSAPLQLADDCQARGSFIVKFDVHANGETSNIQPPPADACVRTALTAWVASFKYAPQAGETPMAIEWLMVEAKQGG